MTDPFSILASTLTVLDASKSVIKTCEKYIAHAKHAPQELNTVIEDLEDLNTTIGKLEDLAKTSTGGEPAHEGDMEGGLGKQFDEWKTPLQRLGEYAQELTWIVGAMNLEPGWLNGLLFRSTWSRNWQKIKGVMTDIDRERAKLHLATTIEGVGMTRKIYTMISAKVALHLPPQQNESPVMWRNVGELQSGQPSTSEELIFSLLATPLSWPRVRWDYPALKDPHQRALELCAKDSCEGFLTEETYVLWKERKSPGPGLLYCSGGPASGKTILCSQVVNNLQELQSTGRPRIGVAYAYDGANITLNHVLRFWIMQLAIQSGRAIDTTTLSAQERQLDPTNDGFRNPYLTHFLLGLLPHFERTFLVIDDIDRFASSDFASSAKQTLKQTVTRLLQIENANVSVALFGRTTAQKTGLLDIADVSVRLVKSDVKALDLTRYVQFRVHAMLTALEHGDSVGLVIAPASKVLIGGLTIYASHIVESIVLASDGLYLAADMFVASAREIIVAGGDLGKYTIDIIKNSEIMMQRDPEIMKQKRMVESGEANRGQNSRRKVAGQDEDYDILPMRRR